MSPARAGRLAGCYPRACARSFAIAMAPVRAILLAGAFTFAVSLTSCTSPGLPLPRGTSTLVPSPPPTITPSPTVTPTPDPNAVSANQALADCPATIEVTANLVGTARTAGIDYSLVYPNISTTLKFGIHPSLVNAPAGYLPIDTIRINENFRGRTGISPDRQIISDLWFLFYKAWQHDGNNEYMAERGSTTFNQYLSLADKGEEVGFSIWALTDKSKHYPDTLVAIDPMTTKFAIIFTTRVQLGGFQGIPYYDPVENTIVYLVGFNIRYTTLEDIDWREVQVGGYLKWLNAMIHIAMPEELQRLPGTARTQDIGVSIFNQTAKPMFEGLYPNFPFLTRSSTHR